MKQRKLKWYGHNFYKSIRNCQINYVRHSSGKTENRQANEGVGKQHSRMGRSGTCRRLNDLTWNRHVECTVECMLSVHGTGEK